MLLIGLFALALILLTASPALADPITLTIAAFITPVFGTASTFVASALVFAATTAVSIGVNMLLAPDAKAPPGAKSDPGQVNIKQSLPTRKRAYGRAKMGGAVVLLEKVDGGQDLIQAIVHAEGPWDAIEEIWLDDKKCTLTPSHNMAGTSCGRNPWSGRAILSCMFGEIDQVVNGHLDLRLPASVWGADHRLQGLVYTVLQCDTPGDPAEFQANFPSGVPVVRVVGRAEKVLDPRTGLTAWSDNNSLCIMDYLTHERGFAIPDIRMDHDSFAAFADVCDELIPLKIRYDEDDLPLPQEYEKRYRVGGGYDLTEEPRQVLRNLLASCDAELIQQDDGTVGIRGGVWTEPTVTIDESIIIDFQYEQGNDKLSAFNQLKISFNSADHDYQPTEADAWEDLENQALTGEVKTDDLSLPMVQHYGQARRLGKIAMAKGNPRHKLNLITSWAGLAAHGERIVRVVIDELLIDEPFLVTEYEISIVPATVRLTLASLSEDAYSWDPETEEGDPPPPIDE